ncbi:MAG: NHLP-related RiPP peptide [Dokdonella sp.]
MSTAIPTPAQLDQLLGRLGSDDAFREKYIGDPVSALAEHGVHVDPADVPAVRSLPSKETFRTQAEAIRAKADGKVGLMFFVLGA